MYPSVVLDPTFDGGWEQISAGPAQYWADQWITHPEDFNVYRLPDGGYVVVEVDGNGHVAWMAGIPCVNIAYGYPQREWEQ